MAKVAVLGLGAMGARMAARLIDAGHVVNVWNRTAAAAEPLAAKGAQVAATPREAVRGVEFAIAMVRDDEASAFVWSDQDAGALAGLEPGATVIECSTLSLPYVGRLAEHCQHAELPFLDAPVAGSRMQAEAGKLIFLVGGAPAVVEKAKPLFEVMGAAIKHAGPNGAGAAVKLAVNALFGVQVAALAELIAALRANGVDVQTAVEIISATPVCSPAAKLNAEAMLAGAFAPQFPVELVSKDLGYALLAAQGQAPMTQAAKGVVDEAVRQGFGADNLTGVIQLYR